MKKLNLMLSITACAVALMMFGCAKSQNTNTATMPAATPEPTPDSAAIVAEITRIENDWPRILKEHDAAAVRRIEADDVVVVYPDGSLGGKEQDVKDIEAGNLSFDEWKISDLTVKVLDADSAVAVFFFNVTNGKYKSPNGASQDISGRYRSVDTFARRNGQWQLVGSATVPVRGPAPTDSPSATPAASPSAAKPASTRRPPPLPPERD
jgi:ketosteroid isomerase-like protein